MYLDWKYSNHNDIEMYTAEYGKHRCFIEKEFTDDPFGYTWDIKIMNDDDHLIAHSTESTLTEAMDVVRRKIQQMNAKQ